MFAYVPARGGSRRIPRKNIRALDGRPLLAHVLGVLRHLPFLDGVHVSTDDPEIVQVAEAAGASCLGLRAAHLANDAATFQDLIREDIPRFSAAHGGDQEVLLVLATAALVPEEVYRDAFEVYRREKPDVLISCEHAFPYGALVQKPDGYWQPLFPDKVVLNSQHLPKALADAGLFYFFNLPVAQRATQLKLVDRLLPYVVPERYTGDIDRPEDLELLEMKYLKHRKGES